MRVVAFLGIIALVACSTGGGGTDADGGTDSGSSGGVTLVVNSTSTPSTVGPLQPPSGTYFQELNITLGNVSSSKAVSASFLLYTLKTDQLLVLQFSTASDAINTPCAQNISVAAGGSYTCNLVFEMPQGQKPVTLYYDDTVGDTASADMPPPPPPPPPKTDCETMMSWNGSGSCTSCIYNAQQGSCGTWTANAACSSTSDQLCSPNCPNATYCSCLNGCLSAKCLAVAQAWFTCVKNACTATCGP